MRREIPFWTASIRRRLPHHHIRLRVIPNRVYHSSDRVSDSTTTTTAAAAAATRPTPTALQTATNNPSLDWDGVSHSTSDFVTHVLIPPEQERMTAPTVVECVQSALEEQRQRSNNDNNNNNNNNVTVTDLLSAADLIALGAVWYLPADAPRNPAAGVKPQRLSLQQQFVLSPGDYLRIHHNPRRFLDVYKYDWSRYVTSDDDDDEQLQLQPQVLPGVWLERNEEKGWLVIEKPPLVPVHPTVDNAQENVAYCLQQALAAMKQQEQQQQRDDEKQQEQQQQCDDENHTALPYVSTPHRLDQNTSGLFVVATSKAFAAYCASLLQKKTEKRLLEESFCSDGIHKVYKCLVCLLPPKDDNSDEDDDDEEKRAEGNASSTQLPWSVGRAARTLQELANAGKLVRHYLEPSVRAPKRFVNKIPEKSMQPLEENLHGDKNATLPSWPECLLRIRRVSDIYTLVGNRASEQLASALWSSEGMPHSCQAVMEVEVELLTGRTHQIRGQFEAMGFPLVGDSMYGGAIPKVETGGYCAKGNLALQCNELEFLDPDVIVKDDGTQSMIRSKRWNKFRLEEAWWSSALEEYERQIQMTASEFATTLASDVGLTETTNRPICMSPSLQRKPFDTKPARPELLPDRVLLSPGKNKYVLIRATHARDNQVQWFVKSAAPSECGGPYHGNVAQDLREWIEAAGYEAEVTGGGRIDYRRDEQKAIVYGFSYGFGRGDHAKVATLIEKWSKGAISATVDNTEGLY